MLEEMRNDIVEDEEERNRKGERERNGSRLETGEVRGRSKDEWGYKSREVMCSCTFCLEAVSVPATK